METRWAVSEARIPREFRRPYRPRQSVDLWRAATTGAVWVGLAGTLVPWWFGPPGGVLRATAAWLIAVGLALLALPRLRRRMPYEVWHLLHLSSYAVLVLSVGHQFAVGQELSVPGFARYFSLFLWGVVVAAVVWGRAVAPVLMNRRH